ncbi:hypothetical protein BD779DRAFT_1559881 [Infundibulicybe gibba]|nr:hypothetical protein BD779DRAFT_1559881 [Infundibulicybe gibba]
MLPAPPQFLPPIEDPIIEDSQDDKSSWEWYFGENAGGYLLWFGKHEGKRLHQIPEPYLRWCLENINHPRVLSAVKIYYTGLEALTKTDYDRFIIPFGTKHKGQTIRQCQFPLFFLAVDQWLGNPRKYGVQRDIGDLLRASEYHDDIDIKAGGSDDEPNSSDDEFIDDSDVNVEGIQQNSQESDMDTSDETQATGEHQTQETDMDSDTNDGSQSADMSEHDNVWNYAAIPPHNFLTVFFFIVTDY